MHRISEFTTSTTLSLLLCSWRFLRLYYRTPSDKKNDTSRNLVGDNQSRALTRFCGHDFRSFYGFRQAITIAIHYSRIMCEFRQAFYQFLWDHQQTLHIYQPFSVLNT